MDLLLTLAILCSSVCQVALAEHSLEMVQILYRHGDRSPTHPLPKGLNNAYWSDGAGELTNVGKQQHYELGQFLRARYNGFLNATYNSAEVYIRSTDKDRTLMSAYSNLAGLYAPHGQQVWNDDLLWQPIPVHTRPKDIDYITNPEAFCLKYYDLKAQMKLTPEVVKINNENKELYAKVRNETGYPVYDFFELGNAYDALFCDMTHNLTVPEWALPVWKNLTWLREAQFYYEYGLPQLSRLRGGPMLGNMIDNINAKISGATKKQKAYFYSTHDTMLIAFLSAVGVYNKVSPPYASAVIVELLKMDKSDNYSVQILYRNDTSMPPYLLTVPSCTSPCPLHQFVSLTAEQVPVDILEDCQVNATSLFDRVWVWSKYLSANTIYT